MRGITQSAKTVLSVLLALFMLVGCTRPIVPTQAPEENSPIPELTGSIRFAERSVQADMREVAVSATVSLINAATNESIASSVTDAEGIFSLKFGSSFRPSRTAAYFLEAVKGLSAGGDSNRAGASLARVRTLIYWRSGSWKSISRQGIIVNRSTTALSIITNLRNAAGQTVNTEGMINALNVGFPDNSLSPATPDTFQPGASQIGNDEYHQVFDLVTEALDRDVDPVFAVSMDMGPPRRYLRTEQGFSVQSVTPTTGMSNDTVTLAGYAFDPVPSNNVVKFNGWKAEVLTVSADREVLTVKVPRRLGLSGSISVQIGGLLKTGPVWTQTGWKDPYDDSNDLKDLINTAISSGALTMQGGTGLGFVDTTNADFMAGAVSGPVSKDVPDPVDGGDGAVTLQIGALRVLQVYPDGQSQLVAAQGVYNWRPDLFSFDTLPVTTYNTLTTLDATFSVTVVNKSGTVAPATATLGGTVTRTLQDYDILYFGVADSYARTAAYGGGGMDLTVNSRDLTRSFALLGRGIVFTHDTLPTSRPNFFSLTDLHGMAAGGTSLTATTVYQAPGVNTSSPVLNKPFNLSAVSSFPIQNSHSSNHVANPATVWYAFKVTTDADAKAHPYWTTFTTATSNAAFFSYGHTQAVPSEYEAKAMINSMYYTFDRGTTVSGSFTSRAFNSGANGYNWAGTRFSWVSGYPSTDAKISFQVAATNDPAATDLAWKGPDGTAATSYSAPGAVPAGVTGRYLRYKATLTTNSIESKPILSRVDIGSTASTATTLAIAPNSLTAWSNLSFSAATPGGSTVRIQVLSKDGVALPDSVLPDNSAGFNTTPVSLAGLSAIAYPELRLKIILLKQAGGLSPTLDHAQVTWTP